MGRSIKHHYVPRFYLKKFCIKNTNNIYCYDKLSNKSYLTKIEDIGHHNLFYGIQGIATDEFEKAIARVEGKLYAPAFHDFATVKNFAKTSYEAKQWFFVFLAYQMLRTNQTRLEIKETYKKVIAQLRKEKLADSFDAVVTHAEINIDNPEFLKALHILYMLTPPYKELFFMATKLFNKKWVILLNMQRGSLWTSDNPISFYNSFNYEGNLGIVSDGVEIRFPLTNNSLLFSYDPNTNPPKKNKVKMSNKEVEFSNICQLRSSNRFIYSSENNFEIAREYLDKNPIFRDPDRARSKVIRTGDIIETIRIE